MLTKTVWTGYVFCIITGSNVANMYCQPIISWKINADFTYQSVRIGNIVTFWIIFLDEILDKIFHFLMRWLKLIWTSMRSIEIQSYAFFTMSKSTFFIKRSLSANGGSDIDLSQTPPTTSFTDEGTFISRKLKWKDWSFQVVIWMP